MRTNNVQFLRRVLALDAASAAVMGVALLALGPAIAALTALPVALLRDAGIVLLPFAAFVAHLARRAEPPRAGVWAVIVLNALWVIDSIGLLVTGWVEPSGFGFLFVIAQALVVGVFAELEYLGLKHVPARAHV